MFMNELQGGTFSRSLFEYELICHFSAHLFVLANDRSAPTPEPVKVILESYLAML